MEIGENTSDRTKLQKNNLKEKNRFSYGCDQWESNEEFEPYKQYWGGQYQGSKSAETSVFSNFELNFSLTRSKETKINYPIVFGGSKFTRIDMLGCTFHEFHYVKLEASNLLLSYLTDSLPESWCTLVLV